MTTFASIDWLMKVIEIVNGWVLGSVLMALCLIVGFYFLLQTRIAILILSPKALRALKDYEEQKDNGLEPQFHPRRHKINNAKYWDKNNSNEQS